MSLSLATLLELVAALLALLVMIDAVIRTFLS